MTHLTESREQPSNLRKSTIRHSVRCLIAMAALLLYADGSNAVVLNVDTVVDDPSLSRCDDAVAADCSLRGAIARADTSSGSTTINLPAGRYVLSTVMPCLFHGPSGGVQFNSPHFVLPETC